MTGEAQPQDIEHLRLLSIFHYVVAALQAVFASFPIIHFVIGAVVFVIPHEPGAHPQDISRSWSCSGPR